MFAALTAASALLSGAVQAAPITYNVNQTIGLGGVVGTVQTDGTVGVLGTGNFAAWDLTLNGDSATYHITNADSIVLVVGNDVTATATNIFFNYNGGAGNLLLFQQGLFSGMHYWCNATLEGTCFQGATVVPEATGQTEAREGNQVIATAAVVDVPEPASLALLSTALAGMGLVWRRRAYRTGVIEERHRYV